MKKTTKYKKPTRKNACTDLIVWEQLPPDDPILDLKEKQIIAARTLASLQYSKNDTIYTGAVDAAAQAAGVGFKTIYRWLADFHFLRYVEMLKAMRASIARQNLWKLGEFEGSVAANIYELKLYSTSKFNDQYLAEKEVLELKVKLQTLENEQAALSAPKVILEFDSTQPEVPEELKQYLKVQTEVH